MIKEAIINFKTFAPMLLPKLIDNNKAEEAFVYDDYAVLPYTLPKPMWLQEVMDLFDDTDELVMLYHLVPSDNTLYGRACCAYSAPSTGNMYKLNVRTAANGLVEEVTATIYDSLEVMHADLMQDMRLNERYGVFKYRREPGEIMNDFC